jgi:hypothetical protein
MVELEEAQAGGCVNLRRARQANGNIKMRVLADGSTRYDVRIQVDGMHIHLGTTHGHWAAKELARINIARALAGEVLIGFKRAHRWASIMRVEVDPYG